MFRAELTRTVGGLRRRMPRYIFSAFCLSLLLLLGCACGPAQAGKGAWADNVTLFEGNPILVPVLENGVLVERNVKSFASPFLAAGGGVMVALSEAGLNETANDDLGVLAMGHIETEGPNWADKTTQKNGRNWVTQHIFYAHDLGYSVLRRPTAVIKGNKIHLLALKNRGRGGSVTSGRWHFGVFRGRVSSGTKRKLIYADQLDLENLKLAQEVEKQGWSVFPGYDNSALLRSNGTIVFSVNATNKENESGYAILQLKDDEKQWEVSFVVNPGECSLFSLFEWRERLIGVFSGCPRDGSHVKEYDETSMEWKDADDTSFLSWGSMQRLRDFTPVTIGNKTVLLFTKERSEAGIFGGMYEFLLFFTDGNRVYGPVERIKTHFAKISFGKLLYTNGELFFMYQDTSDSSGQIVFQRLNRQLREIESTLNAWAKNDAYLSKPCNETVPEGASSDTLCVTPMPTAGLVGFLSNTSGSNYWGDEYRFRSATVEGAAKVENGFAFSGAGEGVRWPVGETYMGKRYDFTRYGLTLVATVSVHETPKGDSPLLTVNGVGANRRLGLLGLWYKDNQWKVGSRYNNEGVETDLIRNTTYKVALTLQNNTISAYVDGKSLGSPWQIPVSEEESFDIGDVFIGRFNLGEEINMTVTNVLLYNRVLNDTELETSSRTVETATPTDSGKTDAQAAGKGTRTLTPPKETPKTPTDPKEDSSEHVCVGASLLFLLGLRALALLFSASI